MPYGYSHGLRSLSGDPAPMTNDEGAAHAKLLAEYRGYDHLTSEEPIENGITANEYTLTETVRRSNDTSEGSTHLLQDIQNVCIFCTNGDPDHA